MQCISSMQVKRCSLCEAGVLQTVLENLVLGSSANTFIPDLCLDLLDRNLERQRNDMQRCNNGCRFTVQVPRSDRHEMQVQVQAT